MTKRRPVMPLEVGKNWLEGYVGTELSQDPYIKLLAAPVYRNERWEALAQVNTMLAMVEVTLWEAFDGD